MFGCLRKLGCLTVLVAIAAAAYFYRDQWLHIVDRRVATRVAEDSVIWEPISDEGAARARRSVESLGRRSGPVFANVSPGDLTSFLYIALSKQLPRSADNVQAAVVGDRMYVRADVALDDFKSVDALGPLAGFLDKRATLQMGGTFDIVRPGLAQFLVEDVKIRDLALPQATIPRVLRQIRRGSVPDSVAENGLPLEVPTYIGDVRAGKGRVTIYKSVP